MSAFDYVRRTREISRMTLSSNTGSSTPSMGAVAQGGGELFKGFSALGNRVKYRLNINFHFANRHFNTS